MGLDPRDLAFQDRDSLFELGERQWAKILLGDLRQRVLRLAGE